jgi:hypothetical protein
MDKGTEDKVHLVAKMISKLGCNFIAINNAATCLGDSILRNITENFERPALSDHVILVGAPIVLNPPTKAADL